MACWHTRWEPTRGAGTSRCGSLYGSRIAIQIALVSTTIGVAVGTAVGAVSGYYGGWIDDVLMRFVGEILYSIPFLVLVIAFMAAFGRNLTYAMIGGEHHLSTDLRTAHPLRGVKHPRGDVRRGRTGRRRQDRNILLRHVIPNSFAPVVVQTTLQMGTNILIVAGLSFLGFGAQPPPLVGTDALYRSELHAPAPWFSVWPGLAIPVTVMAFNILGDGLRDILDPRLND